MLYGEALALIADDTDRELVAKIYELYEGPMYGMALSILHDPTEAEDAVQTAFVRIIDHLQIICEKRCHNHKAYFVIIAKHVALNMLNKRKDRFDEDIDEHYDLSDGVSVEEEAISRLSAEDIAQALKQLSDAERDIMYLYLYEEMKPKEIAELMGIRPNTASQRIFRAREKLAGYLRERGISYE